MFTKHEDKSMQTFSSDRVRRAVELRTVESDMTADEQNEVGIAVALAAERASRGKWREPIRQAAQPTEAEAAAEAEALAAWAAQKAVVDGLHRTMAEAERDGIVAMHRGDHRAYDRALARGGDAASEMPLAALQLDIASGQVGRVRGENMENARERQRRIVERW